MTSTGVSRITGARPMIGRPIIGRAPVIRDTPIDVIAAFHARRYVPRSVVIAAAGSVDHDAIVDLAQRTQATRDALEPAPAPEPAPVSPREPVATKTPRPADRTEGMASVTIRSPESSSVMRWLEITAFLRADDRGGAEGMSRLT